MLSTIITQWFSKVIFIKGLYSSSIISSLTALWGHMTLKYNPKLKWWWGKIFCKKRYFFPITPNLTNVNLFLKSKNIHDIISWVFVYPQNYVEALTPNVMLLDGGELGRWLGFKEVMSIEPPQWDESPKQEKEDMRVPSSSLLRAYRKKMSCEHTAWW